MTEKSSFFNSVGGDRKYQASDFAEYFSSLVTNGVFPNPATNLQVLANANMTVTVKAGPAWIKGYRYLNDSDLILPITVADGVLNRIDRIALRMDTVARNITAVVKKGTFASVPVSPTLQRDADAWELGIADIYVGAGATSITQINITDLRLNTALCGWVNSLIQADTTAIFDQYFDWYTVKTGQYQTEMKDMETQFQADFSAWFTAIQGQLTTDAAGNLQTQITALKAAEGIANGVATLDSTGKVPLTQLGNVPLPANATASTTGIVEVAAVPTSGAPIVSSQVASAKETQITGTAAQTVATYTPTASGNFEARASFRVVTGTTNVTIAISYTSVGGAQTYYALNAQACAVGEYSIVPFNFNAVAGQPITIKITASVANQAYASGGITGV